MGKRGPLPQPGTVGHRKHPMHLVEAAKQDFAIPEPPRPSPEDELLPQLKRDWETFWRSDVASVMREADVPALRRLFLLRNEWERLAPIAHKAPVVQGSTGQLRVNPIATHLTALDAQILRLENEFGLTPASRQRLGLVAGQAQLTLNELNKQFALDEGDEEDDPRLELLEDA